MSAIKYAIVPVEPTQPMMDALAERNDPLPHNEDWRNKYRRMYRAMLASAPPSDQIAVPIEKLKRMAVLLLHAPYKADATRDECGELFSWVDAQLRALLSPTSTEPQS